MQHENDSAGDVTAVDGLLYGFIEALPFILSGGARRKE
jgi:hypothetical protein